VKAKLGTRSGINHTVAYLGKHKIVAGLNPINLPGPQQFFRLCIDMNPDATR